jgi:hypothetical protein
MTLVIASVRDLFRAQRRSQHEQEAVGEQKQNRGRPSQAMRENKKAVGVAQIFAVHIHSPDGKVFPRIQTHFS